jgi:endonuclease YncB( thermonuclease family)
MQDIIYGIVDSIIEGNTFIINVTDAALTNKMKYNRWERISIATIETPELDILSGVRDKAKLESIIQGRVVSCAVQSRDAAGRVVADVKVI